MIGRFGRLATASVLMSIRMRKMLAAVQKSSYVHGMLSRLFVKGRRVELLSRIHVRMKLPDKLGVATARPPWMRPPKRPGAITRFFTRLYRRGTIRMSKKSGTDARFPSELQQNVVV